MSLLNFILCSYAQLELTHGLIRATTPVYTKYSYKATPTYKGMIGSDNSPGGKAVSRFGKIKTTVYSIDVDAAALACAAEACSGLQACAQVLEQLGSQGSPTALAFNHEALMQSLMRQPLSHTASKVSDLISGELKRRTSERTSSLTHLCMSCSTERGKVSCQSA